MRVRFGDVTFDSDTREVTRRGEILHITPKAFLLLQTLIEQRPSAVSREDLMERVWPDVVVEDANLKNLVAELRAALGDRQMIRTVRGFGYGFAAGAKAQVQAVLFSKDQIFALHVGENTIGRAGGCEVVLQALGVSRKHARVTVSESGRATIEDLDSKNGTFLNGTKLTATAKLEPGDTIGVGVVTLMFRVESDEQSTATIERSRRS